MPFGLVPSCSCIPFLPCLDDIVSPGLPSPPSPTLYLVLTGWFCRRHLVVEQHSPGTFTLGVCYDQRRRSCLCSAHRQLTCVEGCSVYCTIVEVKTRLPIWQRGEPPWFRGAGVRPVGDCGRDALLWCLVFCLCFEFHFYCVYDNKFSCLLT